MSDNCKPVLRIRTILDQIRLLKRPDPNPNRNKYSVKFLLETFWRKYALKTIVMVQKFFIRKITETIVTVSRGGDRLQDSESEPTPTLLYNNRF
jgi:hypothetical protein